MMDTGNIIGPQGANLNAQRQSVNDPAQAQDRFLKLLVAQLNNQDPMNPLDNAQMTSQIAQINTVTGIEQLNQTMQSLAGQLTAMQLLQGTALIGRTVLTEGNTLGAGSEEGKYSAAFDLAGAASHTKVQITDASGQVVDTIVLGACAGGRNYFSWDAGAFKGDARQLRFAVVAENAGQSVAATALAPHAVLGASSARGRLQLELDDGSVLDYDAVKAVY